MSVSPSILGNMRSTIEHVVIAVARRSVTIEPVSSVVGHVSLFTERFHHIIRRLGVVFNDENAHRLHIDRLQTKRQAG